MKVLGQPHTVKAYEWASNKYSKQIAYDNLRYGDIITNVKCKTGPAASKEEEEETDLDSSSSDLKSSAAEMDNADFPPIPPIDYHQGHVFFFDSWVDSSHNEFWVTTLSSSLPVYITF